MLGATKQVDRCSIVGILYLDDILCESERPIRALKELATFLVELAAAMAAEYLVVSFGGSAGEQQESIDDLVPSMVGFYQHDLLTRLLGSEHRTYFNGMPVESHHNYLVVWPQPLTEFLKGREIPASVSKRFFHLSQLYATTDK